MTVTVRLSDEMSRTLKELETSMEAHKREMRAHLQRRQRLVRLELACTVACMLMLALAIWGTQ